MDCGSVGLLSLRNNRSAPLEPTHARNCWNMRQWDHETVGRWECGTVVTPKQPLGTARNHSCWKRSEKCGSTRCTKLKLKLKLKPKCQPVRELPVSDSPWQPCLDSNTTLGANGEHVPLGRATDNHYRLPVPPHPQNKLTWW